MHALHNHAVHGVWLVTVVFALVAAIVGVWVLSVITPGPYDRRY